MISPKPKILLVEDDRNLGIVIHDYLEMSEYKVILAKNGQEGLDEFKQGSYNLVLLDVMLPLVDGFSVAEEIRKTDCETPIIFITAKSLKEDRIKGFKLGADDYITKPFSTEELKLRISAVLRRTTARNNPINQNIVFKIGNHSFDYTSHLLTSEGNERRLTKREAELLHLLCLNMNRILRRDIALKTIWGEDDYFMGRSMDVYITKLRKMLGTDPDVSIVNIHNTGFKLDVKKSK
jgi:two-component system response regulator VicR